MPPAPMLPVPMLPVPYSGKSPHRP